MKKLMIQHWLIKCYCGMVTYHNWRSYGSGYGGNGFRMGTSERCGYYSKKACSEKNCPIYNCKKTYEAATHRIVIEINKNNKGHLACMKPIDN